MKINNFITEFEKLIPRNYQEDFDNTGLLVGDINQEINKILLTLDCTEEVINEAISKGCNFVLSFHPIIFKGLKSITGKNYVERIVLKAIKNNIAIYSIHTALDNNINGVNKAICDKVELINTKILIPKKNILKKLTTYVPKSHTNKLKDSLFNVGAGNIGNYENCSFNFEGEGTFKGGENSNPYIGTKNKIHKENEICINITFPKHLENTIIKTLQENHPYEEVAYEIITLDNKYQNVGIGMIGDLKNELSEKEMLSLLKEKFNSKCIRHSKLLNKNIKKVAVLGGSGSFAIENAIKEKADIFVSSDFKYHDFFRNESKILLTDIGHYESEQFTNNILISLINKKFPKLAVYFSNINTNSVNYF